MTTWKKSRGGRALRLDTDHGYVEILLRDRGLLGHYTYHVLVVDRYGRLDSVKGYDRLAETKALAEEFVAKGLA